MLNKYVLEFSNFISENYSNSTEEKVNDIKKYLIEYYNYDTWESFVDSQEEGDCQEITKVIENKFDYVKRMSGQMDICGDGSEYCMYHYWIEFDGNIFDFTKGTLYDYVDWDEEYIYNPFVLGEDWKLYKPL